MITYWIYVDYDPNPWAEFEYDDVEQIPNSSVCVCVCVCACVRVCVVLYLGVFRSLLFSDFLAPPKCVMKTEEYTN